MSAVIATTGEQHSPIDRQIEAYHQSWEDHRQTQEDWPMLTDMVYIGLFLSNILHCAEQAWRDHVYRGSVEIDQETENKFQSLWQQWLDVTNKVLTKVEESEKVAGPLQIAGTLREKAEQIGFYVDSLRVAANGVATDLNDWQPPRLSRAVGLRDMTLTQNEADELKRHIEDAKKNPPSMPKRKIETKDASFLYGDS